jgi:hypothetical protein
MPFFAVYLFIHIHPLLGETLCSSPLLGGELVGRSKDLMVHEQIATPEIERIYLLLDQGERVDKNVCCHYPL